MVEHAAVNRVVVGSSPTSGANFPNKNEGFQNPDTVSTQEAPDSDEADVRGWPKKIKHRNRVLAKIYKSEGREGYRVAWHAGGQRRMKSFAHYGGPDGAKPFADAMVKELARNTQVSALTPKLAQDALTIAEILHGYQLDTGRRVSPVEAVSAFVAAAKLMPANASLPEAARLYARTMGAVKPKPISEAVTEFLESRKQAPKTGERARHSPVYARNLAAWLTEFAKTFSGHQVTDLTPALIETYLAAFKDLSAKARNDRRASVGLWLRWCGRRDYIADVESSKLLGCDAMKSEVLPDVPIKFYTPDELEKILLGSLGLGDKDKIEAILAATNEASRPALTVVTALQAFGGARQEEALRLRYEDLYRAGGHIEISGALAKTRKRRLLEVGPALKAWLAPFKGRTGPIWSQPPNSFISEAKRLRQAVGVTTKKNGLRRGFLTFNYLLRGENETVALAGTSPQILHQHYRGLAGKKEAAQWFAIRPPKSARNIVQRHEHEEAVT